MSRYFSESYQKGDIVIITKAGTGIKVGQEGKIVDIDYHDHRISIVTAAGDIREIDLKEHGHKISLYREKETPFTDHDRVIFLKNNKSLNVQNGLNGTITSINEKGELRVQLDGRDKEVSFSICDYPYLDHGYAVTEYKSQGQTTDRVFYHVPAYRELNHENRNTFNSFYVSLTRGRSDIEIYTDDIKRLQEQVKKIDLKSSTLDYPEVPSLRVTMKPLEVPRSRLNMMPIVSIVRSFVMGKERAEERER
jgi:ATP-dependent exoDNAse (exonuclease V) alpha subunit